MEIAIPLTIVFVVLKLIGVIDWSWWWVFSPLWIVAIITGIMYGVFGVASLFISRRERRRMTRMEGTLETTHEIIEYPPKTKTIRSTKRIAFCIIGVILLYVAGVQSNLGYEYYEWTIHDIASVILLPLALYFTVHGSYIWAKEKGRSGWWCLMGTIAPIGYLVLTKLKDKRLGEKETSIEALGEIETDFKEIPATQDNGEKLTKATERFCPKCGHKLSRRMIYCPNCGSKVSN